MLIETPELKKTVKDYDFTCVNGMVLPITVDLTVGDVINFYDSRVEVHLATRPSLTDPLKTIPAEDMTIFLEHVVSIQRRDREVIELSQDQKAAQQKVWQELTSTTVQ